MSMKRFIYMFSCLLTVISCAQKLDNSDCFSETGEGTVDPGQNSSGPQVPDKIDSNQVKVISFNVRVGSENGTDPMDWPARRKSVKPLLTKENPTVIGLQEALRHQMNYIALEMEGYSSYGLGRDDGKDAGEIMAIFWNDSQVERKRTGTFWLSEGGPEVPLKGWDASYMRTATWGEFVVRRTGQKFFFLNTHVDNDGSKAKVQSIILIKKKIEELNPNGYPVIITGDFNAELSHTMFEPFTVDSLFVDARSTAPATDTRATYHGFGKYNSKIDHIFYSGLEALEYRTINRTYEGVTYISDHYPIAALFELTMSADPDAPQVPGNYGDMTEEGFPFDDKTPQTGAGYGDLTEDGLPFDDEKPQTGAGYGGFTEESYPLE